MEDGTSTSQRHNGVRTGTAEDPRHRVVTVLHQGNGTEQADGNGKGDGKAQVDIRKCSSADVEDHCRVREILDRVADKWSLLVISLLAERGRRFTELRAEIDGISQRMLTLTLRRLERDGLVRRTVHPVVPPRVDYDLTPLGATLIGPIEALVQWVADHTGEIVAARAAYEARGAGDNGRNPTG
jgi:DNA-binding HxlR family transcriptional regulator